MKLGIGSTLNMAPASGPWEIAFDLGDGDEIQVAVCPVIGWATVVTAHLDDGTAHTELQPAFVWGDGVWTESELREHTPGLGHLTLRHATLPGTAGPRRRAVCPMHDDPSLDMAGGCTCDD